MNRSAVREEAQSASDKAAAEMKAELARSELSQEERNREAFERLGALILKLDEAQAKLLAKMAEQLEQKGEVDENLTKKLEEIAKEIGDLRKQVRDLPVALKAPAPTFVPRPPPPGEPESTEPQLTQKERTTLRTKLEGELYPFCAKLDKTTKPEGQIDLDADSAGGTAMLQVLSQQHFRTWVKRALDTAFAWNTREAIRTALDKEIALLVCDGIDGGTAPKALGEGPITKDMCLGWFKPKIDRAFVLPKK